MSMTVKQALAAREALHEQETDLLERVDQIGVVRERIRQAEDPLPDGVRSSQVPLLPAMAASASALAQARIDAARGVEGAAAEIERLAVHIEDTERRLTDGLEHERVLNDALGAVRGDIERLYVDEAEAWFAYAERFTRRAHELLDALRAPMADALDAWNAAAQAWQPIAAANGLSPVQRCPLPPAGASEPVQPVDGAMLIYQPVDPADEREAVRVSAGTGMFDALSTDPDWELVGGQGAHGAVPVARPADVEPSLEASVA